MRTILSSELTPLLLKNRLGFANTASGASWNCDLFTSIVIIDGYCLVFIGKIPNNAFCRAVHRHHIYGCTVTVYTVSVSVLSVIEGLVIRYGGWYGVVP